MQISNVTMEDMSQALKELNLKYDGNIEYKRLEHKGHKIIFTLKVKDNKGLGAATNLTYKLNEINGKSNKGQPKHSGSASWFVHGYFYEEILKINSKAVINSTLKGKPITIDKDGGNWQDVALGSDFMGYVYMSELADNEP